MKEEFAKQICYIQSNLSAPKSQMNKFGNYKYRNCEDILTAVKPLLKDRGLVLTITDNIEHISVGNGEHDRIYVKATARIEDGAGNFIENNAYAREPLSKKGMDEAQVTGATSSYARKYALNGLLCIDDTKDADSQDNRSKSGTVKSSNFAKSKTGLKDEVFDTSIIIKKQLDEAASLDDLRNIWGKCNKNERLKMDEYKNKVKEKLINKSMEEAKLSQEAKDLDDQDVEM